MHCALLPRLMNLRVQSLVVLLLPLLFDAMWSGTPEPALVDITKDSGLGGFKNVQGTAAKQHIIETMGGGAAFLDYNRDGKLDPLLVRGTTVERFREGGDWVCALYRGDGKGHFQDVTADAGITARGWGMGIAVGDIDNDGWEDIYVTGYGSHFLFHNLGNGKFADVTAQAGVADLRWSVGAAFADIDRDGDLDLYVANYLVYELDRLPKRSAACTYRGFDVFCGPRGLPGSRDARFLNDDLYPDADRFGMGLKYKQRKLLFLNQAGKGFKETGDSWGTCLESA